MPAAVRSQRFLTLPALLACLLLGGCSDWSRYSTKTDEAYCGSVTLASEFREGLSPRVQLRLTLDADALDLGEPAGQLTTNEELDDGAPPRHLLDHAELRPIAPLAHDALSRLEFGEGRERNVVYAVSPSDPEANTLLAIVSLRSDDQVEVRLLRPGGDLPASDVDSGRRSIFGVFPMSRKKGTCGF
jgi:hypothetical protein